MKLQRIIPQAFNIQQKLSLQSTKKTNSVSREKEKFDIDNYCYRPISLVNFQANPTKILQNELRALENIHCPTCGTRILNNEEFIKAVEEVLLIKNTEDYFEFINKYRSSINPAFKNIINSVQKYVKREPEKTIEDIVVMIKGHYTHKFKHSIDALTEDYKTLEFFSPESFGYKEGILPLQELKHRPDFSLFIKYLLNITKDLPENIKQKYFEKYLNLARETILEVNAFQFNKGSELTTVQNLCKNLLKLSSGKTTKFLKNTPAEIDVLSCKGCTDFFHANYTEIKRNKDLIFQYINDVAEAVNKGRLNQKEYPLLLFNNIKKYLKIVPTKLSPALSSLDKNVNLEKNFRLSDINMKLTKLNGVPCAYCGAETHSHDFQKKLEEQIANAKNIAELAEILQKNVKFINERYLFIVEAISGAANQNPNFDSAILLKNLQNYVTSIIHKTLVKGFGEVMNDYHQLISSNDKSALRDVKKSFFNDLGLGLQVKKLQYKNYREKLIDITNNIESKELKNIIWTEFHERMKDLFLSQQVLFVGEEVVTKVEDQLKIVIMQMLRSTIATIEHMDAIGKYKESPDLLKKAEELDNLIIACKNCNKEKRGRNMRLWGKIHPEIIKHFKNYLAKIKEIKETDNIIDISEYDLEKVARKFEALIGKNLN